MSLKVLCFIAICISGGRAKPAPEEDYPPKDLLEMAQPLHDMCVEQNGITDEDVKNYRLPNRAIEMMCYMRCIFVAAEWITEDGVIQYDYIAETVHPQFKPYIMPSVDKCHDIDPGTHKCEIAFNFHICLKKQDPEVLSNIFERKQFSGFRHRLNYIVKNKAYSNQMFSYDNNLFD